MVVTPSMRMTRKLLVGALLALGLALPVAAGASIVERVVAVVGERPILLTELQHRARPFLARIYGSTPDPAQRSAHETEMYKQLLNRMIDDRLEEHAADRAHLSVTPEEIDNAIKNVSKANNLAPSALIAEAKRQGLTEQDYRDELRRQLLEGKLVQLRVRGRVRITEQDAHAMYDRTIKGAQAQAEVRILAMRIPPGADSAVLKARQLLAEDIVTRARAGEDFCKMVTQYSDDQATLATCGSRGPLPLDGLIPAVQTAIRGLKAGEVAEPIDFSTSPTDQALLVVQLVSAPRVPLYDEVKDNMMEQAFGEAMDRQRKIWLDELRRGVYVDSRL
jgi:peptidyl-prolyl cis-trans isomerase SurA